MNETRNLQLLPEAFNTPLVNERRRSLSLLILCLSPTVLIAVHLGLSMYQWLNFPLGVLDLFVLSGTASYFGSTTHAAKLHTERFPDWTFWIVGKDGELTRAESGRYDVLNTKIFGLKPQMTLKVSRKTAKGVLFERMLEVEFMGEIDLPTAAMFMRWYEGLSVHRPAYFDEHDIEFFDAELRCTFRRPCYVFEARVVETHAEEEDEIAEAS